MKKFVLAGAAALLALGAVTVAAGPAQALRAENQATVTSFEADYYLDTDADGRSTLRTVETIVMDFAIGAGEHGPIRELVEDYEGHPTDLEVLSVVDENGAPWNYEAESDDGYSGLKIGDADVELEGSQTYVITYLQHNTTLFPDDSDGNEFYWDVNGTQWQIPVDLAVARVHIPQQLADRLTGTTACYAGPLDGQAACDSEETTDEDGGILYTATASGLAPEETLTFAIGFEPETFVPRATTPFTAAFFIEVFFAAIVVLLGLVTLARRRTVFADEPGRPTIIAEYLPAKDANVITSAIVLGKTSRAVAAQLVDLAVRRNIRIIEEPSKALFSNRPNYTLQLLTADGLAGEEAEIAKAFLGNPLEPGLTKTLKNNDTELAKDVYAVMQAAKAAAGNGVYFRKVKASARVVPLLFGFLAMVGTLLMYIALWADARDMVIPSIVFVLALLSFITILGVVFRTPLTARGAELRDHLKGLQLYISVAEKQRLEYLQSPEGAERVPVDTGDAAVMLKLYERVLPYAVLFNEEKKWAKVLGDYYDQQPPEWYSGSTAFSTAAFASGISSISSFTSAAYSGTTSSSSSGSGGGGSSGGGGGGGGGGSW